MCLHQQTIPFSSNCAAKDQDRQTEVTMHSRHAFDPATQMPAQGHMQTPLELLQAVMFSHQSSSGG